MNSNRSILIFLMTFSLICLSIVFASGQVINPGHPANRIGGTTDAERTFNSTGRYTFLGDLVVGGNLTVGSSLLFVNNRTGNVGIGTTNPTSKLQVIGNVSSSNFLIAGQGLCIGTSCITSFTSIGGAHWTASGNNIYNTNTGNVGIGTTNPQAKLHVAGDIYVAGGIKMSRVEIKGDGSVSPGLNADKLDGYSAEDFLASSVGTSGMPLQGVLVLFQSSNNVGISSVPLSLPKAGCNVKVTVCDYGGTPPTRLIIGADPVARITRNRINEANPTIFTPLIPVSEGQPISSCNQPCNPPQGYIAYGGCFCVRGPMGEIGCTCFNLCPVGTQTVVEGYCLACPSDYPNFDSEDRVCYKEPRCPAPSSGQVFIGEDDTDNVCVYCPADRPKYDPTTKACIRESSAATIRVGNCATLSTQLPVAFTDVTFADANNNPISTADYVAVGYSCAA